jgi:hypothetical protein
VLAVERAAAPACQVFSPLTVCGDISQPVIFRICWPCALRTSRPTDASDGAKYFWLCVGICGAGAGLTRTVMPLELNVSPSAAGRCWNALLSACCARIPYPGPFRASALSTAIVTCTILGPYASTETKAPLRSSVASGAACAVAAVPAIRKAEAMAAASGDGALPAMRRAVVIVMRCLLLVLLHVTWLACSLLALS